MGAGVKEQFSNNPMYDKFFVLTGTASPTTFPTGTTSKMFRLKGDTNNIGPFRIGNFLDNTPVYPIYAGDDIGWNPAPASFVMSEMVYDNPSGTSDYLYVWMKD